MPTPEPSNPAPPAKGKPTPYIIVADNDQLSALYYELNKLVPPDEPRHAKRVKDLKTEIRTLARLAAADEQLIYVIVPGADRSLSIGNHPRKVFDEKRFEQDHPTLYQQYIGMVDQWEVRWKKL